MITDTKKARYSCPTTLSSRTSARYADGNVTFWSKGTDGLCEHEGKTYQCTGQPSRLAHPLSAPCLRVWRADIVAADGGAAPCSTCSRAQRWVCARIEHRYNGLSIAIYEQY